MGNVVISRTIGENILLNKHSVRALPFYEYPNSKALDIYHDDGFKQIRTLRNYPAGYDFSCNIINAIKQSGRAQEIISEGIIDNNPYYFAWIKGSRINEYLASAGDHTKRQSLGRQLRQDLSTGFVTVGGGTDKGGHYLMNIAPFRIIQEKHYETGMTSYRFAWAKVIFETLVTDKCTKSGADGYILLPQRLYPISTQATVAAETLNAIANDDKEQKKTGRTHLIGSSNPIYKLEVYARMRNTNDLAQVLVNRKELLKTIVPELTDGEGNLRKIAAYELHDILVKEVKEVLLKTTGITMLSNLYIGKAVDNVSTLHFQKANPSQTNAPQT